jgi:hypothetical protein
VRSSSRPHGARRLDTQPRALGEHAIVDSRHVAIPTRAFCIERVDQRSTDDGRVAVDDDELLLVTHTNAPNVSLWWSVALVPTVDSLLGGPVQVALRPLQLLELLQPLPSVLLNNALEGRGFTLVPKGGKLLSKKKTLSLLQQSKVQEDLEPRYFYRFHVDRSHEPNLYWRDREKILYPKVSQQTIRFGQCIVAAPPRRSSEEEKDDDEQHVTYANGTFQ